VDGRYRRMRCGVLPDPAVDPVLYLAKAHSYPRWLVRDWVDRWGITETTRLCEWFNRPPTLTLRVNRLVQSRDAMLQALHAAGVSATAGQCEEAIGLQQSINVRTLPGFDDGWFSVQDESAMSAARLLQPQSGERILDLCAAPGGKTTHLAELMQNQGQIMAVDADAARLQTVLDNARRLQLNIIEVASVSATGDDLPPGPFDAALVDVPCSNTGVLGKRPEARWRITAAGIDELVQTQYRLLLQACEHVRPGGQIVYSTCSIEPRENRQLVDRVLAEQSQLELVRDVTHVPGQPGDGGYQTLLRRGD
jgi:16S rRNA (cytosine967-C5)-methyltransferase